MECVRQLRKRLGRSVSVRRSGGNARPGRGWNRSPMAKYKLRRSVFRQHRPEGDIRGGCQTIASLRSPSLTFQLVDADAALLSDRLAVFEAWERYHHEEDVVGSRCR